MEQRQTFKFFRSFYEAACLLNTPEEQAGYLMAICEYALNGTETALTGAPAAMLALTKPNLDASKKKAEAGSKGGYSKSEQSTGMPVAECKQTASKPVAERKQPASKPLANDSKTQKGASEEGSRKKEEEEESKEYISPPLTPPRGKSKHEQAFEAFWALYPKKRSMGQAKTAWDKLKPSDDIVSAIMAKLPLLIASEDWKKNNGQFIPYPATWLNAKGWLDEVKPAPAADHKRDAVAVPPNARKNAEWMRRMLEEEKDE